jgi:ribosomal-protein-alanine N-acetyltransferase
MDSLNHNFHIQTASLFDLSALRQLEKVCFPLDAWPLLDLIGALSFPNIVRYKAVLDGEMIGFIAGEVRFPARIGWIATVAVHPDHRRKGIARKMIRMVEEEMGQPRVRLTVRESNTSAINLYQQDGYVQISRWEKYYKGGEDGIVMEKLRSPEFERF